MSVEPGILPCSVKWRDSSFTCHDGVKLTSRLWHPSTNGPWPTLLMRQPYGRAIASTVTYAHPSWWASHGYLVVIQDVRGQGGSEGVFKGFKQEESDTSETHQWVRDLPECNGRLGTFGFSYQGLTQLLAKAGTPPPDCLAPAMTGLNEGDHWSCEGGAQWWHINLAWGIQLAALQARRRGDQSIWEELRQSLNNGNYLWQGISLLKKHDPEGITLGWLLKGEQNTSRQTIHKPLESWLRQPMLLLGGWWDPHLKGILDLYHHSKRCGGFPELHIGAATHLQWWPEAQKLQLDFFNRHLKSKDPHQSSSEKQPRLWNITKNCWQYSAIATDDKHLTSPCWSLCCSGLACLDAKDGTLEAKGMGSGALTIVHDPWRPVPSIGGHLSPLPGPVDRRNVDMRSDVATFTSSAIKKSINLAGIPKLNIQVQADQNGFDLCAAFSVIKDGNNSVEQLSSGILRIQGQDSQQLIPRQILFQPMLAEINEGDYLRLSIAGSSWPAIGVNPGHADASSGPPSSDCRVISMTMDLADSSLQLLPMNFGKITSDSPQEL